jgi:hypothetical protein
MPMFNKMSALLDKIERRLGTKPIGLPAQIGKDVWAKEVICNETLDTFSRYFPASFDYILTSDRKKGDYYLIDENICNSIQIIGVGDIDWHEFSKNSPPYGFGGAFYSAVDLFSSQFDVEDIMMQQMMADHTSIFKTGIYVDYVPPNLVQVSSVISNHSINVFKAIPVRLYIKHADNLMTIEPTKMEIFEQLAMADVATFLVEYLRHFDGVDTVFATTDLKLNTLEEKANRRDDIVQKMEEGYVSAANKNQPLIITI